MRLFLAALLLLSVCRISHSFVSRSLFEAPRRERSAKLRQVMDHNVVVDAAATIPHLYDGIVSAINPNVDDHPFATILGSYLLVTAADMVPFVPCQPLAIALGSKLGFSLAFPITSAGQTTAGVLAFSAARRAADSDLVREASGRLDPEALVKFDEFRRQTSREERDDGSILLGLIGLRLAPFFPFSAENYLLGGGTAVPLSLFTVATLFGCLISNLFSTSLGAGGAAIILSHHS